MAYKYEEARRAYHRAYMREMRQWRKEHHVCVDCGCEDSYTLNGRTRCFDCSSKHKEHDNKRDKQHEYEKVSELRAERREKGLCTKCGDKLPSDAYPYVMCGKCRASSRVRQEIERRGKGIVPKSIYQELGLCVRCGKPRAKRLTAWGGMETKLCAECYENTVSACAAGRAAYTAKHGTTWGNYKYELHKKLNQKRARTEVR